MRRLPGPHRVSEAGPGRAGGAGVSGEPPLRWAAPSPGAASLAAGPGSALPCRCAQLLSGEPSAWSVAAEPALGPGRLFLKGNTKRSSLEAFLSAPGMAPLASTDGRGQGPLCLWEPRGRRETPCGQRRGFHPRPQRGEGGVQLRTALVSPPCCQTVFNQTPRARGWGCSSSVSSQSSASLALPASGYRSAPRSPIVNF